MGMRLGYLGFSEPVQYSLGIKQADHACLGDGVGVIGQRATPTHHGHKAVVLELPQYCRTSFQGVGTIQLGEGRMRR